MEYVWIVLVLLCAVAGIIGSIAPLLPGLLFSLIAMLMAEFLLPIDFTTTTWIITSILLAVALIADYILPIRGTKRYGGTQQGVRGSMIGLIVGLFIPPWGLIIGPLLGAFIGEYMVHDDSKNALRAARGSFVGSALSSVVKIIASGLVLWFIVRALWFA